KTLFEDQEGNIWIGTEAGLGVMDVKTANFIVYKTDNEDVSTISGLNISSICQTKDGTIWIGTSKAGFNRFDKESGTFTRYLNNPTDSSTLVDNRVRCITEGEDANLWIGTLGGGLTKFDPVSGTCVNWRAKAPAKYQKDKKEGLPNDMVYGILKDDNGNLWMSTNMGISKFNPRDESFRNYDVSDGLQGNEFTADAFYKSRSGEMYFGGNSGFSVFHPDSIHDNTIPPKIAFNSFKLFNEEIVTGTTDNSRLKKPINYADTLFLSYKDYVFSFEFAALHFGIPRKNQLAYQMVGFDRDWNYVGTRKFATYTNLDPGEYTFRVKGTNSDGIWNEKGRSIHIIISPPFWETWWFRILAVLVLVLGVLTTYNYRINKIKQEEKRKTALNQKFADLKLEALRSQLNPHFVFNCLNSIQGLINKKDDEAANLYLTKFSRLMRMILEYSRKPEILIKDEMQALELYLELENMRFRNKFDYQITLDKDIDVENMKISPMLMQPYVENAIKHGLMHKGTNGKIDIRLNLENSTLHCTIKDNGIGRQKAAQLNKTLGQYHKSAGMALTKERLDILNSLKGMDMKVTITDLFDDKNNPAGTEVKIAIPVEYNY
ncbi:MAG: histidine kinase, partial [Flavobacteriales bacterium]|nr:histidine kinase [Flavobacteriales bacterium]